MAYFHSSSTYKVRVKRWILNFRYITSQTIQLTLIFAVVYNLILSDPNYLVQIQWNALLAAVICSKHPLPLKLILHCSEYCSYADVFLEWATCSTRLVALLVHHEICHKGLVWMHLNDKNCSSKAKSIIYKCFFDVLQSFAYQHWYLLQFILRLLTVC